MTRERSVPTAPRAPWAGFDRIVEFVNLAIAVALLAAAWVLVVELLAWFDRDHGRR